MKHGCGATWVIGAVSLGVALGVGHAEEVPEWSGDLCEAVEQAVQLLNEGRLTPDLAAARMGLMEALIRSADPSAEFLDEDALASRYQRLSKPDWFSGLVLAATDQLPKVAGVFSNSPAAAAGILPGDLLESVAGQSLADTLPLTTVRSLLAQGNEASIEVGLKDGKGEVRTVDIERLPRPDSSVETTEILPADMGYIRLRGIRPGTADEVEAALDAWKDSGVFGAILDLRGSCGNAVDEVAKLASRHAAPDALLYVRLDRAGEVLATVRAGAAQASPLPLMVLMDEGTSGAAELLAAVLGGSVRGAMLIGRESAGDPALREPMPLPDGRHVLLATRQIRTADGAVYDGRQGVRPDVLITDAALVEEVFEPDAPILRRGKTLSEEEKIDKALRERIRHDTYLRRATDVLLGLQALGYDKR